MDPHIRRMALVMHIISPCVRPKRAHKQNIFIFPMNFAWPGSRETARESLQPSEPDRLGGGRGRVNLPPRRLVLEVWEVWRVWCWLKASTGLEARGLGGFSALFISSY